MKWIVKDVSIDQGALEIVLNELTDDFYVIQQILFVPGEKKNQISYPRSERIFVIAHSVDESGSDDGPVPLPFFQRTDDQGHPLVTEEN